MTEIARSLTLKIDANAGDDLVVLLKQALYEIEKLLPPEKADTPEARMAAGAAAAIFDNEEGDSDVKRVRRGHTDGSIGRYSFEYILSSQEYHSLEKTLLEAGYVRKDGRWTASGLGSYYTHAELPSKVIQGSPLAIVDAPSPDEFPF